MLKVNCSKKFGIFFLLILTILSVAGCSVKTGSNEYSKLGKESLIKTINEMTITESDPLTSEKLIEACNVLSEKAENFTDEELLAVIKDDKMTSITKSTLIQMADQINQGKGISDQSPFEKFIPQKSLAEDVRINLIHTLDMSSTENKGVLENIVKSEEGAIVVRSLITLQKVNSNQALRIANEIINNDQNFNDDAIRVAVMVKSNYFQDLKIDGSEKNVTADKKQYIDFCINKYNISQDDVFKDAMAFSLMNIFDFDAVKAIVKHKNIDDTLKTSCISRNYQTFVEVINNNPSKEDVEFIITAMEILPIRDLADLMRQKLASNPIYSSDRLDNVLTMMETRGVPADKKRYETNQYSPPLKVLLWYSDYFDVSLDYIFGRTDKPQGKLYHYEPEALKVKAENQADMERFVEMCFNPDSPISAKLKETMFKMMGVDKK